MIKNITNYVQRYRQIGMKVEDFVSEADALSLELETMTFKKAKDKYFHTPSRF